MEIKILKTVLFALLLSVFIGCKPKETTNTNLNKLPMLPCKEVKVIGKDSVKRKVMKETIDFFISTHCFINNRGIVKLFISKDDQGLEVWTMYSEIENYHIVSSDIPSPYFEDFDGDIILVYNEEFQIWKKNMEEKEATYGEQVQLTRKCIDQIIGNRVYQIPTREDRWSSEITIAGPTGDTLRIGLNRSSTGTSCKRKVVFYEDETYVAFTKDF